MNNYFYFFLFSAFISNYFLIQRFIIIFVQSHEHYCNFLFSALKNRVILPHFLFYQALILFLLFYIFNRAFLYILFLIFFSFSAFIFILFKIFSYAALLFLFFFKSHSPCTFNPIF